MKSGWMKRAILGAAALVAVGELAAPPSVEAQEVQVTGPLAGAPAVHHMRLYRKNRLQLTPFVGFTLQDPHQRTILAGANLGYHFTDWLGAGVWGAYGVAGINTNLTDEIVSQGVTTERNRLSLPSRDGFDEQVGELDWAAALQVNFIPLRGKLALFQELFLDTDFYIFAGVAFVGVTERADTSLADIQADACGASPGCTPDPIALDQAFRASQTANSSRVAIAPTFGVGLNVYIIDWFGLSIEWRGLPFAWNTSGTDESGSPDGDFPDDVINSDDRFFQFNHTFNLGFVFYLPGEVGVSD